MSLKLHFYNTVLSLGHKDWIHANADIVVILVVLVAGFVVQGLGPGPWGVRQWAGVSPLSLRENPKSAALSIRGLTLSGSRQLFWGCQRFPVHVIFLVALKMTDLSLTLSLTEMLFGTEPSARSLDVCAPVFEYLYKGNYMYPMSSAVLCESFFFFKFVLP